MEEINIGIEEGADDYILNRPQDVKVSDNGTIYILDWGQYQSTKKYSNRISSQNSREANDSFDEKQVKVESA